MFYKVVLCVSKAQKGLFSNFFGHETKRRKKNAGFLTLLWHGGSVDLAKSLKHWIRSNIADYMLGWTDHLAQAFDWCIGILYVLSSTRHCRWTDRLFPGIQAMADRCNIGTFHWQRGTSLVLFVWRKGSLSTWSVDWLTALSIYHSITFFWIPPLVFDRQSCLVNPRLISQTQIHMKTWHSPLSWSFLWAGTTPGWQVVARLRVSRGFARTFLSWSDCLTRLWLHLTKLPPTCSKLIQQWLAAYSSSMGSQKKPPTSRRRSPKLWGTF